MDKHSYKSLLEAFADSPRDLARLQSISDKGASSFLGVIPSKALFQVFDSREFVTLVRLWLGLKLGFRNSPACPFCKETMDSYGYHALTCRKGGCLSVRHNALREAFLRFCKVSGITGVEREAQGLIQGSSDRPADALLPGDDSSLYVKNFLSSSPTCLDFAVINSQQPKYIHKAGVTKGAATAEYEKKIKLPRYGKACADNGLTFVPMVVDSFGSWGPSSKKVFTYVCKAAALNRLANPDIAESYLHQSLSVTLQRYNALSILKHYVSPGLDEASLLDSDKSYTRGISAHRVPMSGFDVDACTSGSETEDLAFESESSFTTNAGNATPRVAPLSVSLTATVAPDGSITLDILPWETHALIKLASPKMDACGGSNEAKNAPQADSINPLSASSSLPFLPSITLDSSLEATCVRSALVAIPEDKQEKNSSPSLAACPDTHVG